MRDAILDALALARTEFGTRLAAITPTDWESPTPCTEWNVRQLVNHVVSQEYRFADNLATNDPTWYVASRDDDFLAKTLRLPGRRASRRDAWLDVRPVIASVLADTPS